MGAAMRMFEFALVAVLALVINVPVFAQSDEELTTLRRQIEQLRQAGKYPDALALAQRSVALTEQRFGANDVTVASALNTLALLYEDQGRHSEAEPLYKRTIAVVEKALGPDHRNLGVTLGNLAALYQKQSRFGEALPLATRALAIAEKADGADHPNVAVSVNNLASLYEAQGRYAQAEPLYKRSLTIREKAFGTEHRSVGLALNNLGLLYAKQGRYAEAEPLYKRSLAIAEKAMGPVHPSLGTTLNNLGLLYRDQGRFAEAESLLKRDLAIQENLGLEHPNVADALNNIALVYHYQGRHTDAEPLYMRSLAIREKVFGANHPVIGESLINLAELYRAQTRYADAEPLYKRGLAIIERGFGLDHPSVGTALNNYAELLRGQGRNVEAEPLYKRSLTIREKVLGPSHTDVAQSLNNLALVYGAQGRFDDAEQAFKRSLAILEPAFGVDHPNVGSALNSLAWVHFMQRDWKTALSYSRRAATVAIHRSEHDRNDLARPRSGSHGDELSRLSWRFAMLVKAAYRLSEQQQDLAASLVDETFIAAQWAQGSLAAGALAQMSARQAKSDTELARIIRERQDLIILWQSLDKQLTATLSQPASRRDQRAEQDLRSRLAAIDARIGAIDKTLTKDFPEYAAFANPQPLDMAAAQALVHPNEAIVLFLDTPALYGTPDETFAWVITKAETRLLRLEPGTKGLAERVAALRCGLDQAAWDATSERCSQLLKDILGAADKGGKLLPFNLAGAHNLYRALFGQAEELIRDKHLLIVASGPLAALPFQVLVTEKPVTPNPLSIAGYAEAAWLVKRHATTVLPSVTSLKALRQFGRASKATQPFMGFGNPLLLGPSGSDRRAWERQSCPSALPILTHVVRRNVRAPTSQFFRGSLADVQLIRSQQPLPETTDELCAVAQSVGAPEAAVYLGDTATETVIKRLSAGGTLAKARIIHFATHGLLAGETEMLAVAKAEPALLLTPPSQPTEEDDGLLTASEITQLKLDADWIVLSACNTAAGENDKPGAEALSGLARAFFYAGARALLVSHWAVNSEATVKLITKGFDELKADPKIGRAEALRRSMMALINKGDGYAHPANWAPFVVVGEGAR